MRASLSYPPVTPSQQLHGANARRRQQRVRPAAVLGDPHRVLGLEPGADSGAVKRAFRRLALRLHPDVCHDPDARSSFQAIQTAYNQLLDRHHSAQEARTSGEWVWQVQRAGHGHSQVVGKAAGNRGEAAAPPEAQQERWRSQLGGLAARAEQRERRAHETRQRAAMRQHGARGSQSGFASTDGGHERLQSQLSGLWEAHSALTIDERSQPASLNGTPMQHPLGDPAHDYATDAMDAVWRRGLEAQQMERLLRLARLAQSWRLSTGHEPQRSDRDAGWDGE